MERIIENYIEKERISCLIQKKLQRKGESDSLDLKIEVGGELLKTTEDFAMIPAGYEIRINPVINGQKMLKVEKTAMEKTVMEETVMEEELDSLGR